VEFILDRSGFVNLVLAGNYQQYLGWMRNVYGTRSVSWMAVPKYVGREEHLLGISASDVGAFHQVGTYWENPVWGSGTYHILMEEGVTDGKAWAMSWDLDWQKSCQMRDPLTPAEFEESRQRLMALVAELSDGD
jgi:hypothetical protein